MKTLSQPAVNPFLKAPLEKTPLLLDASGTLGTYFQYAGNCLEINKLVIQNAMGQNHDIGAKMREAYVAGCKHGSPVTFSFGKA